MKSCCSVAIMSLRENLTFSTTIESDTAALHGLVAAMLDAAPGLRALRDPKTVLQEWAQGKGLPTPTYREIERTGPHHDPQFRVAVELPGMEVAEGQGSTKRAAEKAAALSLLKREGVPGINTDG